MGLEIPATYTFCHKKESTKTERTTRRIKKHRKLKAVDRNVTDYCPRLLKCCCIKINILFKLYLCADTVISLYRGRFYARCAKSASLYREYRYIVIS